MSQHAKGQLWHSRSAPGINGLSLDRNVRRAPGGLCYSRARPKAALSPGYFTFSMSQFARNKTILLFGLITYGMGQSLLYVIFGPSGARNWSVRSCSSAS